MSLLRRFVSRLRKSDHLEGVDTQAISRYYRHSHGGDMYLSKYQRARHLTDSTDNFLKQNRFFTLFQAANHIAKSNLKGDIVECGCWRGHSTYIIADVLRSHGWQGHFWVFDSFEDGLSEKSTQDRVGRGDTNQAASQKEKKKFSSSLEKVRNSLSDFSFISLHKGWIPDVFQIPELDKRTFSLVHLDVDLYKPTKDSLEYFFPKMSNGGIIIIDDYGSSRFPGAQTAVDEFLADKSCSLFMECHLQGAFILI